MDMPKRKWAHSSRPYRKNFKQLSLESGMTGFLCTCNFREKECVRDAYRLLEEFAGEGHNSVKNEYTERDFQDKQEKLDKDKDADDIDVVDALNKELEELNEQAKKPAKQKTFQVIYIRYNLMFLS